MSKTFQVNSAPALTLNVSASSPTACIGSSIVLTSTVSGGTPGYTFSWTGGATTSSLAVANSTAGNHVYTITAADSYSCEISNTITTNFVDNPVLSVNNITICLNTIGLLQANGASSYTWLPMNTSGSSATVSPTIFTTYTLNGSAAGCISTTTVSVSLKPYPLFSFNNASITCASLGSGTINTSGGIGPFNYTWTPTLQTSTVVNNLFPGNYSVNVFDAGTGCAFTPTTNFPPLVPLTGTVVGTNSLICFGVPTGSAAIMVSGGSNKQSYLWKDAVGTHTLPVPLTLAAGVNSIIVTDSITFCTVSHTFFINGPAAFSLNIAASSPSTCLGTSININAINAGGTPAYTYTWTNQPPGASYTVFENAAGQFTYQVTSTDANNCIVSKSITLSFVPNPTVTAQSTSICPLQQAVLIASGATSYQWNTGSNTASLQTSPSQNTNYTVTGTTAGCSDTAHASIFLFSSPTPTIFSLSQLCESDSLVLNTNSANAYQWTGPSFSSNMQTITLYTMVPLQSGNYSLNVTSVEGCTASVTKSITVRPTPQLAAFGGTVCEGSPLNLNANFLNGGVYLWTGQNFTSTVQNPIIQNSQLIHSGTYSLTLTSIYSCMNSTIITASVVPQSTLAITAKSVACEGDTVKFVSNSLGSYSWQGPANFYSTIQNPSLIHATPNSSGIYSLTSVNGPCTVSATHQLTIYAPINPTVPVNNPYCSGLNVNLNASGAASYTWMSPSNGNSNGQTYLISAITASNAGNYTVISSDQNQCVGKTTFTINVATSPVFTVKNETVCLGGFLTLSVQGPYSYLWTGPQNIQSVGAQLYLPIVTNANVGIYSVTATSTNSCSTTETLMVSTISLPLPEPKIIGSVKGCLNSNFSLSATGGVDYNWAGPGNFSASGAQISFLAQNINMSGIYTLTVKNSSNCAATATIPVRIFPKPIAELIKENTIVCVPSCPNLTVKSVVGSAAIKKSFYFIPKEWTGDSVFSYCFKKAGTYVVNVNYTDTNNCSNSGTLSITSHDRPQADFTYSPVNPVAGVEKVFFYNASRGENINQFTWYFIGNDSVRSQEKNPTYIFDAAGNYPIVLMVTNAFGCSDTVIKSLLVDDELHLYVPNAFTPNGDGLNDVFLPKGQGIGKYTLQIFNRWGQLIFESTEFTTGWDGTYKGDSCEVGTYIWKIKVTDVSIKEKTLTGTVTLTK